MTEGRVNVYTCPECGGYTVTVDVDDGVTPMFLACRASVGKCQGAAVSACYPEGPRPAHMPDHIAKQVLAAAHDAGEVVCAS